MRRLRDLEREKRRLQQIGSLLDLDPGCSNAPVSKQELLKEAQRLGAGEFANYRTVRLTSVVGLLEEIPDGIPPGDASDPRLETA